LMKSKLIDHMFRRGKIGQLKLGLNAKIRLRYISMDEQVKFCAGYCFTQEL
jgi:hypothetical protein